MSSFFETDHIVTKCMPFDKCFKVPPGKLKQVCFLVNYQPEMALNNINFRDCFSDINQVIDIKTV